MPTSSVKSRLLLVVFATLFLVGAAVAQSALALTPQTVTWAPFNTSNSLAASPVSPSSPATSNGSGAISYAVINGGGTGCSVNGATGAVSASALGVCQVRAEAAATGSESAGFVDVNFYFRTTQVVTWAPTNLTNAVGIVTANGTATGDGSGYISYSVQNPGTTGCTVNMTPSIQATSVGVCTIRATAAETPTKFAGFVDVNFTFTSTQTVSWYANNTGVLLAASPLTPNALATSTGPGAISYAVQDAGTTGCSVNTSTAVITATARGLCVVRATAAATTYYPSAFVDKTFTFSVNQTVTWTPTTTLLITGATITPSSLATSSGTGAISYSKDPFSTTAGCNVDSNTGEITTWGVGICVITAHAAAGNGFLSGSTSVSFTLTKVQAVTWAPNNTELQTTWSPHGPLEVASTDGSGSITYSVQSAGTTGCTINSSTRTLSFSAIGLCVVRATASASGNWLAGFTDATYRINTTQSVSFMGGNITQSSGTYTPSAATATGGGIIDYSIVSTGTTGCTVDASTGVITYSAVGRCQVKATARANGFYVAGGWNQADFNFYSAQTITWAPTNLTNPFSGGAVTPNMAATSSGPGAITYSLGIPNAACTLNTSTGVISSNARGRCYLRATAAANGYYNSAMTSLVTFTFTGPQTVTWAATNTTNQVTHSVVANALPVSNGGAFTYSVASAGTAGCSVDAATGVITPSTVGTCTIRATAAAFSTYQSGFTDLTFTFVEGQIIAWPATNTSNPDTVGTVTPDALASSNLATAITYSVQSAGTTGCTVNSATAEITAASAGVCVIRATAAASGSVGSDYRDLSFTFNAPSVSVSVTGSGIYLTGWNSRAVLLGADSLVTISGYGFTSDATVTLFGKTIAPRTISASELTFDLPKLATGSHSFVVTFGANATITFENAVQVVSNEPTVTISASSSYSVKHAIIVRAEKSFAKLAKKLGLPANLVCTAHIEKNSTAKDRLTTMNSTKRMCNQMAIKVGAKVATAKMLMFAKGSGLSRKTTLAINF